MQLKKYLNKKNNCDLLDLVYETTTCKTVQNFNELLFKLTSLFSFDYVYCDYDRLESIIENPKPEKILLNISFPRSFVRDYFKYSFHLIDPTIYYFSKTNEVSDWQKSIRMCPMSPHLKTFIEVGSSYGLFHGYTYGTMNYNHSVTTIFGFGGKHIEHCDRTKSLVQFIVPFLSNAYKNTLEHTSRNWNDKDRSTLSSKQLEILKWVKEGKTSWEISVILNKSENTVNYHIKQIKSKLNVTKRAQAVAVAVNNNYIQL